MAIKPKCKFCGKELDRLTAYKVEIKNRNFYYCNEDEYSLYLQQQHEREDLLNQIYDVMLEITNTFGNSDRLVIKSTISSLEKQYNLEDIFAYLKHNSDMIEDYLYRKDISEGSGRIKYVAAVIRNNIKGYLQSQVVNKSKNQVEVDFYFSPNNYKPSKQRRSMAEIERLGDTDVDE